MLWCRSRLLFDGMGWDCEADAGTGMLEEIGTFIDGVGSGDWVLSSGWWYWGWCLHPSCSCTFFVHLPSISSSYLPPFLKRNTGFYFGLGYLAWIFLRSRYGERVLAHWLGSQKLWKSDVNVCS